MNTVAAPDGTGSVTVVADTCFAATVNAPPPGPAGGACTTCTWYTSARATAPQLHVRLFPPDTPHTIPDAIPVGTAGNVTANVTAVDHGPHPAWHARTFSSYWLELPIVKIVDVVGDGTADLQRRRPRPPGPAARPRTSAPKAAGFGVTAVHVSVCVDVVSVAPCAGNVTTGAPVGPAGLTVNPTVPYPPHCAAANPPEHARTANR